MTEPFGAGAGSANRHALGPPGLLRWPSRIPLNHRPDTRPEPLADPGGALDGGRIELLDVVPQKLTPSTVEAEPVAEASAAAPARRGISVLDSEYEPVAKPATAPEARPLGRPGPPALAGAAIAGLLLVVAPLALSALQRPETLATVPVTAGVGLRADGPESGGGSGAGRQDTADSGGSAAGVPDGGAPGEGQPDHGYVPDTLPQDETGNGTFGDGGQQSQGQGGQSQGDGAGGGQNGDGAGSGAEGGIAANGAPQNTADPESDKQGGESGGDPAADGSKNESDGKGNGDSEGGKGDGNGGTDGDGGEGGAPGGDTGDSAAAPMMAGESPSGEPSPEGEDASPSASSSAPAYTALAGPGCPADTGSSYATAGRGGDAAGWATREGGYGLDGCDGTYDAIPVSGTSEYGDGQYAYWTFTPGFADAECDVYVYTPEDASPQWVTDREAMYQIFPGPDPSGSAAAVFGVQQAESKGGWVKVTGFVSPAEQFTVQLTNIGENAVAGQDGATSHVAASAVRTSCA